MPPVDEHGRIRVRLNNGSKAAPCYGWATSAPGTISERSGGYTVEWDDGIEDLPITRWYFDNGDYFDLEAV